MKLFSSVARAVTAAIPIVPLLGAVIPRQAGFLWLRCLYLRVGAQLWVVWVVLRQAPKQQTRHHQAPPQPLIPPHLQLNPHPLHLHQILQAAIQQPKSPARQPSRSSLKLSQKVGVQALLSPLQLAMSRSQPPQQEARPQAHPARKA